VKNLRHALSTKSFKSNVTNPIVQTIVLTSICIWRMGSGWYTSDFHVFNTDIWVFVPPWQLVSAWTKSEWCQMSVQTGTLHLLEVIEPLTASRTCDSWRRYEWEIMGHPVHGPVIKQLWSNKYHTLWECVCIIALVIRHANRIFSAPHYIVAACGLSGSTTFVHIIS
jgi:hypothetical protein